MSLEAHLKWLNSRISLSATGLPNAGDVDGLSLGVMVDLMTMLGDPQHDAPTIHLTGTNGKGSTSHLVSLILREHGLRVGTYGSPHVSAINERIAIDAEPVSDDDLADALGVVRLVCEQTGSNASWFEIMTATAFRIFSDAAVDVQVIEVGMLGRYDATNVANGRVAVVTNVAKDHTDGEPGWRDRVAREKAGIIKSDSALVMGDVEADVAHHFVDEGPKSVVRLGEQFFVESNLLGVGGRAITVRTPRGIYEDVLVSLHGTHQGINAAVAIAAAESFLDGVLDEEQLRSALGQAAIPARLEVVSTDPLVVIDGGHNVHGARVAVQSFNEDFHHYGRTMLVTGMMRDKDPVAMLEALGAAHVDVLVCCAPNWARAMPAEDLAAAARSIGADPEVTASPADAIERALSLASEGDAILVAGSLYVAGAVRNRLINNL